MPSFKMMGLNSSTAGVEKQTAPAQSQYCLVRSICPGERSSPGAAFPLPCWLGWGFSGGGSVSRALPTRQTGRVSAPSAQNFGDLQWANANPDISMNDAIVEAENIYIGYKYYETRYFDTVMGQGNAASTVGSSTGSAWN